MNGFLEGIMYGLLLCLLVGPIFFKILHTSINYGKGHALSLVCGEWTSDIIYIGLVFFAAPTIESLLEMPGVRVEVLFYLGLIGGIFLLLMGAKLALSGRKLLLVAKAASLENAGIENVNIIDIQNKQTSKILVKESSYLREFVDGFLITTLNPFPIFFWLSLLSLTIGKAYDSFTQWSVFFGVMLTVMLTDLLKIALAIRIQTYLKPKQLNYSSFLCGLVLMTFGVLLLVRACFQVI